MTPDEALRQACAGKPQAMLRYRQMVAVIEAAAKMYMGDPVRWSDYKAMVAALRAGGWL